MAQVPKSFQVRVGPQGRVVVPAQLRKEMNLEAGEDLVARLDGEQLVFERRMAVERRLRRRFVHVSNRISLADELIADRRAEEKRERK
jgi:AbrB family looped-hinge helix DNA binding protein